MKKNILTIALKEFETDLQSLSFSTIRKLIEDISDLIQGNIPEDRLLDLTRKETKLWAELQRRGVWTKQKKKILEDFLAWRSGLRYHKRSF
jgi:hypothetical protein